MSSLSSVNGSISDRERVLLVNHRFSRRLLELQLEWLDEVQRELRALARPRSRG